MTEITEAKREAALEALTCIEAGLSRTEDIIEALYQALQDLVSAHGRRSISDSSLLPPDDQTAEIGAAMRALDKARGSS